MHPQTECFPPKSCSQGDGQPLKPTEKPGYCFPKASSQGSGRTGKSSSVHAKLSPELRASLTRASYYGLCSGQVSSSGKGAPSQHCREMKCCILSNPHPQTRLFSPLGCPLVSVASCGQLAKTHCLQGEAAGRRECYV